LTGGLRLVAVDAVGIDAQALEFFHQRVHTVAGLGEHQHLLPLALAHQVHEQLRLALLVHRHDPLLDRIGRDVARADFDVTGSLSICPASKRMSSEKVAENNSV
jgi:hypothetical protein